MTVLKVQRSDSLGSSVRPWTDNRGLAHVQAPVVLGWWGVAERKA